MKRHYKTLHEAKYTRFVGKSRKDLVKKSESSLSAQQNTFTKVVEQNEKSVITSYVIVELESVCRRLQRLCFLANYTCLKTSVTQQTVLQE